VESTRHYQVQSQIGRDAARDLGRHLEGMLALYRTVLPSSRTLDDHTVKIFADRAGFLAYLGALGVLDEPQGWYDMQHRELVVYDTGIVLGQRSRPTAVRLASDRTLTLPHADLQRVLQLLDEATVAYTPDTAGLLSHEGWHQWFRNTTVSEVDMPTWLDEGIGDWFAAAERDANGRYHPGGLNQGRLRDLARAQAEGRLLPLEKLLRLNQTEFYLQPTLTYAQGWALVHFLMQHRDPTIRRLVPRLMAEFAESNDFLEATDRTFRNVDLPELEREWTAWIAEQRPEDPLRELADEYRYRILPTDLIGSDEWREAYGWHLLQAAEEAVRASPRTTNPRSEPARGDSPR
jgi:hypothetical protein